MSVPRDGSTADEQFVGTGPARLYVRSIGEGVPIIVVHGGPDFDHEYLLPEMDRLAEWFRLVYYDQRGRGRSFSDQTSEAVSIESEIEDLDRIREHFGFEAFAVLGHSWGGISS
jgi:proline iminopeptidase